MAFCAYKPLKHSAHGASPARRRHGRQSLKLKDTKDGWIIYSVYSNGVDDGGTFIDMKDYGVAPPKLRMTEEPKEASAGARVGE